VFHVARFALHAQHKSADQYCVRQIPEQTEPGPKRPDAPPAAGRDATLAAAIAHEVNNLLTPIVGVGELLSAHPEDAQLRVELLERAVDRCQRALAICALLMNASRGQADAAACDLHQAFLAARTSVEGREEADGVRIVGEFDGQARVQVPAAAVEHLLLNLLLNAAAASQHGSTVEVRSTYTPRSTWHAAIWRLEIRDRGVGLDRPDVEAINAGGTPHRSSGIGLRVCRLLCEQWGGGLRAEPRVGGGTVFTISLPAV